MKKSVISYLLILAASLMMGCSKPEGQLPDWPWNDPETEKPEVPVIPPEEESREWKDVSDEFGELPVHIRIWKSPSELQGKKALAYIADANLSEAGVDLWSIDVPDMQGTEEKLMTPDEIWEKENSPVIINAGFFYSSDGKNYSSSLALRNSEYMAYNINYASEDWIVMYYPTRAAFLKDKEGKYKTWWTYYNGNDKKNYIYAEPAENSWGADPLAVPTTDFPVKAESLEPVWGIGGGPVLIKDGKIWNSTAAELFNGKNGIMPDGNHPRTAVGVTAGNHILFFVCEGRNKDKGIAGLTTGDVAEIMKERGCIEAMNLDGGGSSCMLVNGKETIKPSDGKQRRVGSTLMIR